MKKVKRRATATIIIALAVVVGLAVYLVRLADNGGAWATYFSGSAPSGVITDRDGVVLYKGDSSGWSFADDWATRVACYHVVGDANGNVGTGALAQFRDKMSGYNFVTGSSGGRSLTLTVDADLNVTAYNALYGRSGAVLVMDYTTGEILCMVSSPADDPANPTSAPAEGTYLNKTVSSTLTPGSVFKLITVAAAIENIDDIYTRQFWCGGSCEVGGGTVTCTGTHGWQTIEQALSNSCNCAFSEISQELGADTIARYAERFGFTSAQTLDGIETAAGNYDEAADGSLDLSWSGIGQYNDLICPYSMLRYVAAIANGGELVTPTLTGSRSLFSSTTRLLSSDTANKIAALMDYNVEYGYGTWNFPGLDICGKTGTAETGDGASHGWFAGFLNDAEHPYAFVCVVENGGAGIGSAAPVINAVLQAAVAD